MGSPGLQESGLFVYFERMKLRTYLFTVRFKAHFDSEWQFKNIVIEHMIDLRSAMRELRKRFSNNNLVVVDNVYSEEEQV